MNSSTITSTPPLNLSTLLSRVGWFRVVLIMGEPEHHNAAIEMYCLNVKINTNCDSNLLRMKLKVNWKYNLATLDSISYYDKIKIMINWIRRLAVLTKFAGVCSVLALKSIFANIPSINYLKRWNLEKVLIN